MNSKLVLRQPDKAELPAISDMCLRSKGHWGYDAGFLEACREVLTIRDEDVDRDDVVVAVFEDKIVGVLQVQTRGREAVLDKLFIDPTAMGLGAGRALFNRAVEIAKSGNAALMTIDADPGAEAFYTKMGAKTVDRVPSTAIEGRTLPFMHYELKS